MLSVPANASRAAVGVVSGHTEALRRLVPGLTWFDIHAPVGTRHVALPSDLCALTVYCNDGFVCREADESETAEVMVTPLRTRPARFDSEGHGELVLALLTPQALIRVLGAPLEGIVDRRVPLEQFCGRDEQRRLRQRLAGAPTRRERVEALGAWIESRIAARRRLSTGELRAAHASEAIMRAGERQDVETVAAAVGITRRQLERDFGRWLGVAPAHYARLVRFQRAAAAIATGAPLADAAYDAGYADQAHLARSVRRLAARTPRRVRDDAGRPGREHVRAAMADRLLIGDAHDVVFATAA